MTGCGHGRGLTARTEGECFSSSECVAALSRFSRTMGQIWFQLLLVAFLVVLNAAFAGAEMALVTLREGQLQRLEEGSSRGALVARLARDPNRFLATIQVGITLAGFLASASAAVSLASPVEELLEPIGGAAGPLSVVLVTILLAYVTLVFGELTPKRVALQNAERWALRLARPLAALSALTRPVVWLLSVTSDVAVRLLGGDPSVQREEVTEEEIRDLVALQTTFTDVQRQIMDGAFAIAERPLAAILVPRGDVFVVDAGWTCDEAIGRLSESGHSRAPVAVDGRLDHATSVAHLRLLLGGGDAPVTSRAIEIPVMPETARVLRALGEMRTSRAQMALVVDEHGGAAGIVTVEDMVEELVGEIYDETDRDVADVTRNDDGSIVLPGRFAIHDASSLGIELPEGSYATVAGLILDRLGEIPDPSDSITVDGWRLEVSAMQGRVVTEVLATPVEPEPTGDDD